MKVENLDQAEAWSARTILGPGKHQVVIESAEESTSSGGHPEIQLEFEGIGASAGGGIKDWLVVIPKTYGKVKMLLEAAGIAVEGGDWDMPVASLKGKKVAIYVTQKPDRNDPTKVRSEVVGYEPVGDTDGVPMDTNGLGAGEKIADEDIPF